MRTRRRATIEDLRLAIDCLPRHTRVAMLEGIRSNPIVVGAYSHRDGICPMLAAHRAGGRTNLIAFARAWDSFGFGRSSGTAPRPATERELRILQAHLEASLLEEEAPGSELAAAIAAHQELKQHRAAADRLRSDGDRRAAPTRRRSERKVRPGDPDRSRELRHRPGWAWTRVTRRYDEYRWALEQVYAAQDAADGAPSQGDRVSTPA